MIHDTFWCLCCMLKLQLSDVSTFGILLSRPKCKYWDDIRIWMENIVNIECTSTCYTVNNFSWSLLITCTKKFTITFFTYVTSMFSLLPLKWCLKPGNIRKLCGWGNKYCNICFSHNNYQLFYEHVGLSVHMSISPSICPSIYPPVDPSKTIRKL